MCVALLKKLAQEPLPATLHEQHEVDRALVLRAAGMVAALLLHKRDAGGPQHPELRVLAITEKGRNLVRAAWLGPLEDLHRDTAAR